MTKKETMLQLKMEIGAAESEKERLHYHLNGLNREKKKTENALNDIDERIKTLRNYL
ncbi:hypothetical protein [Bacillus toyonensis]|uniref:hypothetical protein n=1 Tax=Bacillus toyonensis TaxID=155322 RepID=UPI00159BBDB7|nr:hypothetical protein [Bacillus toyonensis]